MSKIKTFIMGLSIALMLTSCGNSDNQTTIDSSKVENSIVESSQGYASSAAQSSIVASSTIESSIITESSIIASSVQSSEAEEDKSILIDNVYYELNEDENEYYVVDYNESDDIIIKSTINDIPVTRINYESKKYYSIKNFVIGSNIKEIECLNPWLNLENLYYDGTIDDWCELKKDGYGDTFRYIENFYYKDIEGNTTYNDNKYKLLINLEVTKAKYISANSFSHYNKLRSIKLSNVEIIESYAFSKCKYLKYVDLGNVEQIKGYAFFECGDIISMIIPDTLKLIEDYAFYSTYIIELCNKSNVDYGFNCLSTITNLDDSRIKNEDGYKFYREDKDLIILFELNENNELPSDGLIEYARNIMLISPFSNSSDTIIIPSYINELSAYAFGNNKNIKKILMPNTVNRIGNEIFGDNEIDEFYYDGTINDWLNIKFTGSSFSNVNKFYILDDNGDIEFNNKKYSLLTNLVIPEGVIEIGDYSFSGLKQIKSISLPSTLSCINNYSFSNIYNLTSIILPEKIDDIKGTSFENCYSLVEIYYLNDYNTDFEYRRVVHKSSDEKSVLVTEGDYVFGYFGGEGYIIRYLGNEENIITPTEFTYDGNKINITRINDYAFYNTNAKNIIISEGIEEIGICSFLECFNVETIYLPNTLKVIQYSAFDRCYSLNSINLVSSLKIIRQNGFEESKITFNKYLGNLYIGLDDNPYYYLFKAYNNQIHPDCKVILGYSFFYKQIEEIIIPSGVKSIQDCTFYSCEKLKKVVIPKSVKLLCLESFAYCYSLSEIEFEGTIDEFNSIEKEYDWNRDTKITKVICSNGEIKY